MRFSALVLAVLPLLAWAEPKVADRIVATVNLHAITRSALAARLKPLGALDEQKKKELEKGTLNEMIEELLIADDAARLHLETSDADVERAVQDVASQNKLSVEELWKAAKEQGFEKEEYREMLRQKLTELRWFQYRTASQSRPDAGDIGQWMAAQRDALIAKLKQDAVIEVRQ